jgi:SAM-dependent methyltransferase
LELERVVRERLVLRTVGGGVDYLVEELRGLEGVAVVRRRADGVVVDVDGDLRGLAGVRYFSSAGVLVGDAPVEGLARSAADGVVAALGAAPRFRVGEIEKRWEVRDALVAKGWRNEPSDWDVNLVADAEGVVAEVGGLYWTKRFGELRRAPASTTPVIAAIMVRLAKITPDDVVCDPMCGAGTLLVQAGDMADPRVLLGADHDRHWVARARENLRRRGTGAGLWRGDAGALPLADGSVDRLVANLPFGKRVGSHIGNQRLYPAVLGEIARVLARKGRAVLLTEDKRLFTQTVQRTRGIRVIKEVGFATGGAHPSAYVVTTRRTR